METDRLHVRLPKGLLAELRERADREGYQSAAQLARHVIVQFIAYHKRHPRAIAGDWLDDFAQSNANDPTQRKAINERL